MQASAPARGAVTHAFDALKFLDITPYPGKTPKSLNRLLAAFSSLATRHCGPTLAAKATRWPAWVPICTPEPALRLPVGPLRAANRRAI